jgi:hypothetical protein
VTLFGWFKSSGMIYYVRWTRFGPWFVRFQNNEPIG